MKTPQFTHSTSSQNQFSMSVEGSEERDYIPNEDDEDEVQQRHGSEEDEGEPSGGGRIEEVASDDE